MGDEVVGRDSRTAWAIPHQETRNSGRACSAWYRFAAAVRETCSDLPPRPILPRQELVRLRDVRDLCGGGVEKDPLAAETQRDRGQVHGVADGAGEREVAERALALLEGLDPGHVHPRPGGGALARRRLRQVVGGAVGAHLRVGDERRVLAAEAA